MTSKAATAARMFSGAKCAYRSVILIVLCPSKSRISVSATPAVTSHAAQVCRKS